MTKKLLSVLLLLVGVVQGAMAQEPYAVLSDDNTVLTFYYDTKKAERGGMSVGPFGYDYNTYQITPSWYPQRESITTVVFDDSFADCTSLTSTAYWFYECSYLTTINGIRNLKTDNVTDMSHMFGFCPRLTSLDVSGFKTDKVMDMESMFANCESLTSIDVSSFNTENVTNMISMFSNCHRLTSLDVSGFKTDKVMDMESMFWACFGLTSLDVSGFNTAKVTDMTKMFYNCYGLTSLDVSGFKTDKVTGMSDMFLGCSSLTSLDVSNFDTDNVTDMSDMFSGCLYLTSLDVSGFKTDKVTDMSFMFNDCESLTSLDVSNFDTGNVTDMRLMFQNCSSLTSLDVSNFDTRNVIDMNYMFEGCSGLENIFCNDTWSCSYSDDMFSGCSKLPGFNSSNLDAYYAKPVDDGGYFTAKTEKANKVGGNYWWTYYTDVRNVKADWHTTVYTATLNAEGTELTLNEVTDKIVPRGQAVIMKSTTGEPMLYTSTETGTGDFSTNVLQGTQREISTSNIEGTVYTLASKGEELGFYRYTGETLGARKAYLVIKGAGVRSISIVGNEETGISDVAGQTVEGEAYDLQGRRVSEPQKGLYIVNGKKMVKR